MVLAWAPAAKSSPAARAPRPKASLGFDPFRFCIPFPFRTDLKNTASVVSPNPIMWKGMESLRDRGIPFPSWLEKCKARAERTARGKKIIRFDFKQL
jgi:hypothetical protein